MAPSLYFIIFSLFVIGVTSFEGDQVEYKSTNKQEKVYTYRNKGEEFKSLQNGRLERINATTYKNATKWVDKRAEKDQKFTNVKEDLYRDDWMNMEGMDQECTKKEGERILVDSTCPLPEHYAAFLKTTNADDKFVLWDMEIRKEDRMQFVTGDYQDGYWNGATWTYTSKCVLGKFTTRGDFVDAAHVEVSNGANQYSICYALSLIPNTQNLIAVGEIYNGNHVSMFFVYAYTTLSIISMKTWSNTGDAPLGQGTQSGVIQRAYDVAVTEGDGSIYVIGVVSGGFNKASGYYDCVLLRLDSSLTKIYSKSLGQKTSTSQSLTCNSIQATRNADFLYVGGTIGRSLLFMKMDNYANNIYAVSVTPNSGTENLSMRRIILEQGNAFTSATGNDNNYLYFCGKTDANGDDILMGRLTSGNINSGGTVSVDIIFRYGSPDSDRIADCAMTDDNQHFVGVFNTNHQNKRGVSDIQTSTFYVDGVTTANQPYDVTNAGCSISLAYNSDFNSMLTAAQKATIVSDCEAAVYSSITTYTDHYDSYVYSWRTCNQYEYDLTTATCNIKWLWFSPNAAYSQSGCYPGNGWITGVAPTTFSASMSIYGGCCTSGCSWWEQASGYDCLQHLTDINIEKTWYSSYLTSGCPDYQLRKNVWNSLFVSTTGKGYPSSPTSGRNYRQYMFCDQYSVAPTCGSTISQDQVNFIYDQDCLTDVNAGIAYYSWFIFRLKVSLFTSGNVNNIPEYAAIFGDKDGNTYANTIAVDTLGNIYIHGWSDSQSFGSGNYPPNSYYARWVHAKTHFYLTYELEFNQVLANNGTVSYSESQVFRSQAYMGKRFKTPKKFKNTDSPRTQSTLGATAFDFAYLYSTLSTTTSYAIGEFTAWQNNEDTAIYTTQYGSHSYVTNSISGLAGYTWGTSYARMNLEREIKLMKPAVLVGSMTTHSINLQSVCLMYVSSYSGYADSAKINYSQKYFYLYSASDLPTGLSVVDTTNVDYHYLYLSGALTAASEGKYYFIIRVTQRAIWLDLTKDFYCPTDNYGYFWNDPNFPQLRRFETSQRIKIIVDSEQTGNDAPYVMKEILDQKPIIRQKATISDLKVTNFANCDRFYVSRSRQTGTPPNYQLPYWITFYEQNRTFVMYPIDSTDDITVEVKCCNSIDQCAVSTFYIDSQDTVPVDATTYLDKNFIIQYDPDGTIGQVFTWAKQVTKIYDSDKSSDASDTYKSTDHTVIFSMSNYHGYTSYYRTIYRIGLVFGQAMLGNIGVNQLTYSLTDGDTQTTAITGDIYVRINQKPIVTTTGKAYAFTNYDPCDDNSTTYFDSYFPFLKDDDLYSFSVKVNTWFSDTDALVYNFNRSDSTQAPNWLQFDPVTGVLYGRAYSQDASELIWMKFAVYDPYQGIAWTIKSMLVNCQPKVKQIYKVFQAGVGRQVRFELANLVDSLDGDDLTFSISTASETELEDIGYKFIALQKAIIGKATNTGTIGLIKITATDVHGAYVSLYVTIKVRNYKPLIRKNGKFPKMYNITENQRYLISLSDNLLYDALNADTLVFFASDLAFIQLPSWIEFNPISRSFSGLAPSAPKTQQVKITAMNQYTHDSESFAFQINVISNILPRTAVQNLNYDIESLVNTWFECTLPVNLYNDKESNYNFTYSFLQANGQEAQIDTIYFNPDNRTIYGIVYNLTQTIYRFDFAFSDDQQNQTFANIKLTIKPKPSKQKYTLAYVISASGIIGLLIYLSFLFLYSNDITRQPDVHKNQVTQHMKNAKQRFGEFLDVNVTYKSKMQTQGLTRNQPIFNPNLSAVLTTDFDFQPDALQQRDDENFDYDQLNMHTQISDTTLTNIHQPQSKLQQYNDTATQFLNQSLDRKYINHKKSAPSLIRVQDHELIQNQNGLQNTESSVEFFNQTLDGVGGRSTQQTNYRRQANDDSRMENYIKKYLRTVAIDPIVKDQNPLFKSAKKNGQASQHQN